MVAQPEPPEPARHEEERDREQHAQPAGLCLGGRAQPAGLRSTKSRWNADAVGSDWPWYFEPSSGEP